MHSVKTRTKNFDVLVGQLKKSTRVTQAMADGLVDEPLVGNNMRKFVGM